MRPLVKGMALVALVLFALASEHCRLEALASMEFLCCCADSNQSQSEECEDSLCASIESGRYRSEEQPDTLPVPPTTVLYTSPSAEFAVNAPGHAELLSSDAVPPELAATWHLRNREAYSPRAPSLIA